MISAISSPDKLLLSKIEVLKKGIIDLRQKNSESEKQIFEWNKTALNNERTLNEFKSQINELKDRLASKEELVDRLKVQLSNIRDKNGQVHLKSWISNIFRNDAEEPLDTEGDVSWYKNENIRLKEEISSLRTEKEFASEKLKETWDTYNEWKSKFDGKWKEYQDNLDRENVAKMDEIRNEYIDKINGLYRDWTERDAVIKGWNDRITIMADFNKKFDVETVEYTTKLKDSHNMVMNKNNQILELFDEQENLISELKAKDAQILKWKRRVEEWDEYKPIERDHVFTGVVLRTDREGDTRRRIDITFDMKNKCLNIINENEREIIVHNTDIISVARDANVGNRVWIAFWQGEKEVTYRCEYKEKEIKYLLQFYQEIEYKKKMCINTMMGFTYGDLFE